MPQNPTTCAIATRIPRLAPAKRFRHVCATGLLAQCFLLTGCIEGFDSLSGSDEAYYHLLDYRIDRPRVMGISYWPQYPMGGETVTLTALAATPEHPTSPVVEWWACGFSLTEPFAYYGTDCLNSSIAERLGVGETLQVVLPQYDTSGCVDGCYGYIPIYAIVRGDGDYSPNVGYGFTYISPDYTGEAEGLPPPSDLGSADVQLSLSGSGNTLVTARSGDRVSLDVQVLTYEAELEFAWYTTLGTLEKAGVSYADSVDYRGTISRNRVYGSNVLDLPSGLPPGYVHVYLVITPVAAYYPGLERFEQGVIEVVE